MPDLYHDMSDILLRLAEYHAETCDVPDEDEDEVCGCELSLILADMMTALTNASPTPRPADGATPRR